MGTGSFDISANVPLTSDFSTIVGCFLYDDEAESVTLLPNVRCLQIDERIGPSPPSARFDYVQDSTLAILNGWPSQVEQLWPIDASGQYVVGTDDRIAVGSFNPDGSIDWLFDGFAQVPQADISPTTQHVSFAAVGVAARCWDAPVRGRYQRGAVNPQMDLASGPVGTDLPTRFNPADTSLADGNKGGITPNCTPDGYDCYQSDSTISYPVFLEPGLERTPDPRTLWTISKACRYLMANYNPEDYVNNPDFSLLTSVLQAEYPAPGFSTFDPMAAGAVQTADIPVRDYDASDKAWPDAISDLLGYCGFKMVFYTESDGDGLPFTSFEIYRSDAANTLAPKSVYLQAQGANADPSASNVANIHLARDLNAVVNDFSIESPLKQVECSFILAPGFTPSTSDATAANRKAFTKGKWTPTTTATTRRAYRWYLMDECGDGHLSEGTWVTTGFDFTPIFPVSQSTNNPLFVQRYRPGSRQLISLDSDGNPLEAQLAVSFDYAGPAPGLWDGSSGTWFPINGGWRLLPDRLGIEVTIDDPEDWYPGKTGMSNAKIAGITWWANPPSGSPTNGATPTLRLTTVISDDRMLSARAPQRIASPTNFSRRRRVDARDHFQYNRVLADSLYNTTSDDVIARDDTSKALAYAKQLRAAHEFPPLAGSLTVPWITAYYELGDWLSIVQGRNIDLQVNIGGSAGELPCYPFVVARSWTFEGEGQMTTLQLSDHRAEPRA